MSLYYVSYRCDKARDAAQSLAESYSRLESAIYSRRRMPSETFQDKIWQVRDDIHKLARLVTLASTTLDLVALTITEEARRDLD
jgi:hypothetical protein